MYECLSFSDWWLKQKCLQCWCCSFILREISRISFCHLLLSLIPTDAVVFSLQNISAMSVTNCNVAATWYNLIATICYQYVRYTLSFYGGSCCLLLFWQWGNFFNWKFSYVFNIFYGIKILLFFLFAVYHFKTKVMQEHFINLVVAVWGEDNDLML